jgi:beta-fructofuranosidase
VRRDKFVVSSGGAFTFGPCVPGGLLAPTATCDGRGGVLAIFHMASSTPQGGADMFMTLPRRLTLIEKDELGIEPAGDIESLRGDHCSVAPMPLPANREVVLDAIRGNAMELLLEIDPQEAAMIELNVLRSPGREEYTRIAFFKQRGYYHPEQWATFECNWGALVPESLISIDSSYSSLLPDVRSRAPETAPVYLAPGEPLKLRVFIDKSVVEVFANGRQCVALRVYPSLADSLGVSLRAQGQGAMLKGLDAWQMKSIYA